jgi:hypothetical protein
VSIFNDRAYFGVGNVEYYSDVLNPLNMNAPTNSLTLGGNDPVLVSIPQSFFVTQSGGVAFALLVFKGLQIWQIFGDLATTNLTLTKLSDGVGTSCPRSPANTPMGVMFVATDGVRVVGQDGQIGVANADLRLPFLNTLSPTRVAAAYNTGFYRICTSFLKGGSMVKVEYWYDLERKLWCGPHSLTYDCITPYSSGFLVSGPTYTGSLLQSNVLPNEQTDFYTEFGSNLTWTYQTALIPEFRAMPGWTLNETSIFMGYQLQQNITCDILDASFNVLGTYILQTNFLAPSNATNWQIFLRNTAGSDIINIPSRHMLQLTGTSSMNFGLGSLNAHYQYQSRVNAEVVSAYGGADLDFGLVTDDILNYAMDWGSVADAVLSTVDFEATGTHTGPP